MYGIESKKKIIESKENKLYKMCRSLNSKKFRDKLKLYVVEGEKMVKEAIDRKKVHTVICSMEKDLNISHKWETPIFIKGKLFKELTHTETNQGILAVVYKENIDREGFEEEVKGKDIVILDRLQDPGNVGTILRTADAAGYGGIVAIKGTVDCYSPKVVRAAANSLMRIPILSVDSEEDAIEVARKIGNLIVGTDVGTPKRNYRKIEDRKQWKRGKNVSLIIGNEGNGVSKTLLEKADITTKIPMREGVDSLNASVAAGILIYDLALHIG